ncbi:ribose-5-phosphate isomerase RpiA [Paenibacillus nasutitermitis]|uniref:Ribose-5-phosphate isomerase A n=1 Tax=Paenibacillus nasutitermitis TaxID=1652958 RepID=A0A916Z2I6_9BACL|nr:ribose-5-phosphate isomerase RpiA [Paenibacillus nasutitermitis]GGD71487.1 ribose-5-phosphate isomerase A [Paenibacillus nasutitermitis]
MDSKRIAAEHAVTYIEDGMVVGLGTGSTAYWAIQKIGERIKGGLKVRAVATSRQSERLAVENGIPLVGFDEINGIDLTIDGADEVDQDLNLIKGGGGALLREKIVAASSRKVIIIADESKLVGQLGAFPLPVEIAVFGSPLTLQHLGRFGRPLKLRAADGQPFITDNGNYIIDCQLNAIPHPLKLHDEINAIPGVVVNGLFVQMADLVIIGRHDGTINELIRTKPGTAQS